MRYVYDILMFSCVNRNFKSFVGFVPTIYPDQTRYLVTDNLTDDVVLEARYATGAARRIEIITLAILL